VVELADQAAGQVAQGDEVDDVMVFVERVLHLDRHPVIVAVQALAGVAVERDEVAGAEDELVLRQADRVVRGAHGRAPCYSCGWWYWQESSPGCHW